MLNEVFECYWINGMYFILWDKYLFIDLMYIVYKLSRKKLYMFFKDVE